MADIDYVARAPDGKCVEDLVQKEIIRALRRKVPVEQIVEKYGIQEREVDEGACRLERIPKRKISPRNRPENRGEETAQARQGTQGLLKVRSL